MKFFYNFADNSRQSAPAAVNTGLWKEKEQ